MSDERLIDCIDGVSTFHRVEDGKTILRTSQDVEPLLDINKRALENSDPNWKGDMHHVASVPLVVWESWWKEFGGDPMSKENQPRLFAKLNNKDWCKLRTKQGRI